MQMQNNKPGLFILQTRAGGLSSLIFTLLVTGDREEGNLSVAVLDLFGTGFFSSIFYVKHFISIYISLFKFWVSYSSL